MDKLSSSTIVKIGIVTDNIVDVAKRYQRLFNLKKEPVIHVPDPNKINLPREGAYKRYRGKDHKILLKYTHI